MGRAVAAGVVAIVCIGESAAAARRARALTGRYPELVSFTAGVHPHDAASYDRARDRDWIAEAVAAGAVAIGECGLDYHYDHAPRDRQRAAFADQIELAAVLHKPLVVHTREAEADTRDLIREAARLAVRGVLHCFTGSRELAEVGLEAGWLVSFSGIATFARWAGDDVIRAIPDDRLLVETDAPYLAPVPLRGRRNEPALVRHVAERLAVVRGGRADVVCARTTENARRLFGLATAETH